MHASSSSSQLPSHRTATFPTENDTRTMSPDHTVQTTDRAATEEEDGPRSQLERNRIRAIRRRERETSQERMQRREVERLRAANRRQNESPAESEVRRQKGRLRAMRRRENETEDEKKRRREMNRVRMAERRRELKYVDPKDDASLKAAGPSEGDEEEEEEEEAEHFQQKQLSERTRMCQRQKHEQSYDSDASSDVSDPLERTEHSSTLPRHPRVSSSTASRASASGITRKRRNTSTDDENDEEALPSLPSAHAKQGASVADIIPASGSTLTSQPIGAGVRKGKRRPVEMPQLALASLPTSNTVQQFSAIEENPKHRSHHPTVAIESLLSDNSNISSSSMIKSLAPGMAFSSTAPVGTASASASSSVQGSLAYQSQGYKQLLPPMLPTSVTMANAVAVAAAAAAAAASAPLPPPPSSSFNISHAQSASAMHSLVSTSLAMQKQAATMGMMFQTAAPQMQQMAPVHHHPVASVAGLGIGATLPAASFASNMVVGPLGSFTQPTAASLGQTSIMTTPSSFTSSQSIANNTAATIQGMRTIAAILPTTSVAGSSGRTMTQFRYSTPQTTQTQLQEASESMLAMTMAAGAPSVILHTQATAETMAAAVAAAAVSSNPGHANGTPIARFHPSGVQPHSALQRHGINNQTQSYSQHLPYYYTQR